MSVEPRNSPLRRSRAPWVVGHRGACGEEVENTLESVRLARAQSSDLIEVDVQMTADGHLVLFHDWNLERLAGQAETVVEETGLRTLQDAELTGPQNGERRKIAQLEELLEDAAGDEASVPLNLELKLRNADRDDFAARLLGVLDAHRSGLPWVLVSSFDWDLLASVRARATELPLAPLAKRDRQALIRAGEELDAWSLHAHRRIARRGLVRAGRRAGRPVMAYTVNDVDRARRLLRRGVSGLITDRPGWLRAELEAEL